MKAFADLYAALEVLASGSDPLPDDPPTTGPSGLPVPTYHEVAGAADDVLTYERALETSGALDAADADAFTSIVAELGGSAEWGAGTFVLRDYAAAHCVEE